MTDVLALRTLLTTGYTCLTTYHMIREHPLILPICWSALFVFVNAMMALRLFEERHVRLSEVEAHLYHEHFETGMTKHEWKRFLGHGEWVSAKEKHPVIRKNELTDL